MAHFGFKHLALLDEDGCVWTAGSNTEGQLGSQESIESKVTPLPTRVKCLSNVTTLACGDNFVACVNNNGSLFYFGSIQNKALKQGITELKGEEGTLFRSVSAGDFHLIAIDDTDSLWSYGANEKGECGTGDFEYVSVMIKIGLDDISHVSCGSYHNIAISSSGVPYGWGSNTYGQLGESNLTTFAKPQKLCAPNCYFVASSCGYGHSLFLDTDGIVYGAGYNSNGELGDPSTKNRHSISKILSLPPIQKISTGYQHSLALDTDGYLWSFGANNYGQLGFGDKDQRSNPSRIPNLESIIGISQGGFSILVQDSNGDIRAFGSNASGQLGLGDITDKYWTPILVSNFPSVVLSQSRSKAKSARK